MEYIELLRNGEKICDETSIDAAKFRDNYEFDKSITIRNESRSSKKTKRRSKALKAKMQKIKNADLAERLNLSMKSTKPAPPKIETKPTPETIIIERNKIDCDSESSHIETEMDLELFQKYMEDSRDSSIVDAIKTNVMREESEERKPVAPKTTIKNEWKQKILNLPFRNNYIPTFDASHDGNASKDLDGPKLFSHLFGTNCDINSRIESIIKYLCDLMEKIVQKYQRNWIIDDECEEEFFDDKTGTGTFLHKISSIVPLSFHPFLYFSIFPI